MKRGTGAGLLSVGAFLGCAMVCPSAHAITYGGEYITSWAGCTGWSNGLPSSLLHTDNQIGQWNSTMAGLGHTRAWLYANQQVWASDITEDVNGGQDNLYGDAVGMYALSSHGDARTTQAGKQQFYASMCHPGTTTSPEARSHKMSFNEKVWGGNVPNASPYPGSARWIMLLTCLSVHTQAGQQWEWSFWNGLDMVLGYRGLSADSEETEEVGADYAAWAFGREQTLKASWFYAIEDWWEDDTGALISGGATAAQAASRRDTLKVLSARHSTTSIDVFYAWSWHEG